MADLLYKSTNGNAPLVNFRKALLAGQAPDNGLYMPVNFPILEQDLIWAMPEMSYTDIAFNAMKPLVGDCLSDRELKKFCNDTYTWKVPLEPVKGRENRYVMRLDQGPTASFKDFAAQMMGRLMSHYLSQENRRLLILTATSGDTGSAVANAFYGLDNVSMVVLFPKDEVTARQRKLMTTLGGNITAIAVDGKFDDCQSMVKTAFSDKTLDMPFSSANSINVGRLVPQTVYYFYAHAKLAKDGSCKTVFSVPSGNFGDLTAGLIAYRMGLPADLFISAVNENDEFASFLRTGEYKKIDPSKKCLSNAMNVGNPSNLPRIVDMYEGFMDNKGNMNRKPDMKRMRKDITSESISDEKTRETIKSAYENHDLLLEPHGAVGWAALENRMPENANGMVYVSLETAHPAKFPEIIMEQLGIEPELPESMRGLDKLTEIYDEIPREYGALKELLVKKF